MRRLTKSQAIRRAGCLVLGHAVPLYGGRLPLRGFSVSCPRCGRRWEWGKLPSQDPGPAGAARRAARSAVSFAFWRVIVPSAVIVPAVLLAFQAYQWAVFGDAPNFSADLAFLLLGLAGLMLVAPRGRRNP